MGEMGVMIFSLFHRGASKRESLYVEKNLSPFDFLNTLADID
jgi:hypothetical protein